jgi:hypothetical protein
VADLVTHTCVAVLAKVLPGRPNVAIFVLGTCLPDLLARVPSMGLTWLRWSVPAIPEWLIHVWVPFHMPVGMLLSSFLLAFLFPETGRSVVFLNLLGGAILHLAVDLLQRHLGVGYLLFFPFSWWDFELGWIGSEDTVRIVPVLVPLTMAAVVWRRRRDRASRSWGGGEPPGSRGSEP